MKHEKTCKLCLYALLVVISMFFLLFSAGAEYSVTLKVKDGTDITTAWQKALDKNRYNSSENLKITIPAGTFYISDTLNMYSNTTINMTGAVIKRKSTMNASNTFLRLSRYPEIKGKSEIYGKYNYWHDIKFIGGTFDNTGSDCDVIKISNAKNVEFSKVTFTKYSNVHCLEFAACDNLKISGCKFTDFKGASKSKSNCEAIQLDILRKQTFKSEFESDLPCKNVLISGCTFLKTNSGIGSHNGIRGVYHTNIKIKNNTFKDVYGYAIAGLNYKNSEITGNKIQNCGSGIKLMAVSTTAANYFSPLTGNPAVTKNHNCKISDNTISVTNNGYDATCFGIYAFGRDVSESAAGVKIPKGRYQLGYVEISNNNVTMNTNGYGLWLNCADDCTVSGNTILFNITKKGKYNVADGIKLNNSKRNVVSENKFEDKTGKVITDTMSGISLMESSVKNVIENNSVIQAVRDGIFVYYSSDNNVKKNVVKKSGRRNIYAESSSGTVIVSNKVYSSKNGYDSIYVSSSNKSKINSNTINSCDRDGINLKDSASVEITSNRVTSCVRDGIYAQKSTGKIDNNAISNHGRRGITIDSSNNFIVSNNLISGGPKDCDGLVLYKSSKITVNNNLSSGGAVQHDYVISGNRASLTKDGKIKTYCKKCDLGNVSGVIYHPETIKFTYNTYSYTGKEVVPKLIVKDSNGKTISDKNYTIVYKDNIKMGQATATVTFKGFYSGKKEVTFKIIPASVKNLQAQDIKKTSVKLTWAGSKGSKYYKVEKSIDGKQWTEIATVETEYINITGLKSAKTYQFRVTAFNSSKKYASSGKPMISVKTR